MSNFNVRRREKQKPLNMYYCFWCKRFPFGQVVSSEEDQIAHYNENCKTARLFEERLQEKMNEMREGDDFLKVIERKRKIEESIMNMNSFRKKNRKKNRI